ncbi:KilA-N domain protein, partial [Haemophilus influenzae]
IGALEPIYRVWCKP